MASSLFIVEIGGSCVGPPRKVCVNVDLPWMSLQACSTGSSGFSAYAPGPFLYVLPPLAMVPTQNSGKISLLVCCTVHCFHTAWPLVWLLCCQLVFPVVDHGQSCQNIVEKAVT